ncbi:MAG: Ig domain-containing protein [Planctomycetota bacterium]|nr:Ig domain-containing protein [Planctomycetota bacterium]
MRCDRTGRMVTAAAVLGALSLSCAASHAGQSGGGTFRFLTSSLPAGSTNAYYTAQLLVANAPAPGEVTFSVTSGALPNGLSLNAQTGLISGLPTTVNTFNFTIRAIAGTSTVDFATSIKINASGGGGNAGIGFVTTSLASGTVGTAYSQTVQVKDNKGTVTFGANDLPPGLSMNGQTGEISGTPTAAGTWYVTITANDAGENNNKVITVLPLTILPESGSGFRFTTVLLNNGEVGSAYFMEIGTTGGSNPTFAASGLPPGLSIHPAKGEITGTPTESGTYLVSITAVSGSDSITMNRPMWIAPSTTSRFYWDFYGIPAAIVNLNYDRQPPILVATKNGTAPVVYSASGLPSGISYDSGTGELTGTPVEPGVYPVTFRAQDAAGQTLVLQYDFVVLPAGGGDTNSLAANMWVKKQRVDLSRGGTNNESWKAMYYYNADRRSGYAFDPATHDFIVSLGSRTLTIPAGDPRMLTKSGRFFYEYEPPSGETGPFVKLQIDPKKQTIKLATKNDTFTDSVPGVLRNAMSVGNKGFRLDEYFNEDGKFTPTSGYRKTAFVVTKAKVAARGGTDGTLALSMLLADPAFQYVSGTTTLRFRLTRGGSVLVNKDFTALATGTTSVTSDGIALYKIKAGGDESASSVLAKFSYASKTGKMQLAMKALDLSGISGNEAHLGVELTVGAKTYFTGITVFDPKGSGSYTEKQP